MRDTYYKGRRADAGAGAEAQRGPYMLDRDVGLPRPIPEGAADVPVAREIRVERERAIDQRHHRADILAEMRQREGRVRQDAWILAANFQCSPCEIGALQPVSLGVVAPAVYNEPNTADRCDSECGPIMRIARDRLAHKRQ